MGSVQPGVSGPCSARWSEADTNTSLDDCFAQVRDRRGDQLALAGSGLELTYAELDELAGRYAAAVAGVAGRSAGDCVALLLPHGAAQLAAALGVLRNRHPVVTLNAVDPPARMHQIRTRTGANLMITDPARAAQAVAAGFPAARIITAPYPEPATAPIASCSPDTPAFLICTSGSTGVPKVVTQTHRNMLHNVLRYTNGLGVGAEDRIAWLASLAGGQGLATTWSTLLNGATLFPFALAERGVTGLADWLDRQRITVFDTLPSVLRSLHRTLPPERVMTTVRLVRLASEPAAPSDFQIYRRRFAANSVMASVLGCSEAGIIAQGLIAHDRRLGEHLPVGTVADGLELLLRSESGELSPPGDPGEIVVRSRFLSPGYWHDESHTTERFSTESGVRTYRTGDLGRLDEQGELVVLGRADRQVKIRGNRVQLEEVEVVLARQPAVAGAAVALDEGPRGDARLTAYVSPVTGTTISPAALRRSLRAVLPPHAVPTVFVSVGALPLNANGKLDRDQLAAFAPAIDDGFAGRAPASRTEELLAAMWGDALARDAVGVDDSFLDLGGDSLVAAEIAAGVHDLLGVELDLGSFAADLTIATLAAQLEASPTNSPVRDGIAARLSHVAEEAGPLSFAQESMWRQSPNKGAGFNSAAAFRITGPLDTTALAGAVDAIIARHEIFRTGFVERDGQPVAIVAPPTAWDPALEDLSSAPDPEAQAQVVLAAHAHDAFDLGTAPLVRLRLLRLGPTEHWLVRTVHHIISDPRTWRIFFDELVALYPAFKDGLASPLPDSAALQFSDYVRWERSRLVPGSPEYQSELDWWYPRLHPSPQRIPLPFARPEPAAEPSDGGTLDRSVTPDLTAMLDRLGTARGATRFMTRLAAFSAQVGLDSAFEDMAIDTYLTTRLGTQFRDMPGPMINRSVLRLRFSPQLSFNQWVDAVRGEVIEVSRHATIPYDRLLEDLGARGVRRPALGTKFQMFDEIPPLDLGGCTLEPLPRHQVAPWQFTLGVSHGVNGERWRSILDTTLFDPAGVQEFLDRMEALIVTVAGEPDQPLDEIRLESRPAPDAREPDAADAPDAEP